MSLLLDWLVASRQSDFAEGKGAGLSSPIYARAVRTGSNKFVVNRIQLDGVRSTDKTFETMQTGRFRAEISVPLAFTVKRLM